MKKLYIATLICILFGVSYAKADIAGRIICSAIYSNSTAKCGAQPSFFSPIAYAKWAACMNAANTAYYACIAKTYIPFVDPRDEIDQFIFDDK